MEFVRLRKNRRTQQIRDLLCETKVSVDDLIMPYFVIDGMNKREQITSMPSIERISIDNLIRDIEKIRNLGIKAVLLFGICDNKDDKGTESFSSAGTIQRAIKAVKKQIKDMVVISDVCLCGYTSHGHCGIVEEHISDSDHQNYIINNDKTLEILAKIALSHAESGADFVAPSAMMDGQVRFIRDALDENGFHNVGILAYSAKYASSFYAPFREALNSAPQFGDRKTYQMDFRNSNEALREIKEDIKEGADIVMIKPALSYLDIIFRAKHEFNIPIAGYNVSGEYSMVKAFCQTYEERCQEMEKSLISEILISIKRAGADLIITYHAKEFAEYLVGK